MDVATIGAGFVGSFFSYHLAKRGVDVTIFEEDKNIGTPHCTGILGITGLERLDILDWVAKEGLISNKISGAKIFSRSGKMLRIDTGRPIAYIVDREGLDRSIFNKAIEAGADFKLGERIKRVSIDGSFSSNIRKYKAKVIAVAEGAKRVLIRGFKGVNLKGLLPAVQIDVRANPNLETDFVEVHFIVPDFFLWVVPVTDDGKIWRVGGASLKMSRNLYFLVRLLARRRLGKFKLIRKFGGIVVSKGNIKKFVWGRVIAIGDSAGHVKPTTGGGVVFGGIGAFIAAIIVKKFLEGRRNLTDYELIWKRYFSAEMSIMKGIRFILNLLGDAGIDYIFHFIPSITLRGLRGDFDFHSDAIFRFLRIRR